MPAEGSRREKVLAMMQEVARVFEAGIRAHPEDWHMLQRVFVADLDLARLARAEAKAQCGGHRLDRHRHRWGRRHRWERRRRRERCRR